MKTLKRIIAVLVLIVIVTLIGYLRYTYRNLGG